MSDGTESEFDLAVPFVTVASKGGPHDDDAFTAGFQAGRIDAHLTVAASVGANHYVAVAYTILRGQLDLIAMQHGFTVATDEFHDWTTYTFIRHIDEGRTDV